jgi:hypothetical protein
VRKVLVFGASVLGLLLTATPVQAAGGFSQTVHITTLTDVIPVTCAGPFTGVTFVTATGNGVQHFNANKAGDFWFTSTFEGQGTIVQTAGPQAFDVFQGHLMDWVGGANNLQNGLFHATFNFNGTDAAGQSLGLHAAALFTVNPDGTMNLSHIDVNCR